MAGQALRRLMAEYKRKCDKIKRHLDKILMKIFSSSSKLILMFTFLWAKIFLRTFYQCA